MMRCDSAAYDKFGEIYFSVINSGFVKAWKKHLKMTQNITVPIGSITLVVYDDRAESRTCGVVEEFAIGEDNYSLIRIPPLVWYGFKGVSRVPALIANCADYPHDPDEVIRYKENDERIPYQW